MLTKEQTIKAWHLRGRNLSWKSIGLELGVSYWKVREALYPDWKEKMNERARTKMRLFRQGRAKVGVRSWVHIGDRPRLVPPEVIEEREYALTSELTLSQIFLGDPKPGRSALDQKRRTVRV